MLGKKLAVVAIVAGGAGLLALPVFSSAAKEKPAAKMINDGIAKCYECHDEIRGMKEGSKHAKLSCETCHDNLKKHMETSGDVKPVTRIDQSLCGKCHRDEY